MESNEKKNIKNKILLAIAIIIPVIIGFSYAYFLARVVVTNNQPTNISGTAITSFYFDIVTENGGYIDASNIIPIEEEDIDEYANVGTFKAVSGANSYSISYTISLTDISIPSELITEDFKWELTCTSCSNTNNDANGTFENYTSGDFTLKTGLIIAPNTEHVYTLKLWIQESDEDQSQIINKTFRAKVKLDGELIYQ